MATYPINDENPPTGAGYRPGDIVVCPPGSVVPRWKYVGDEQWVPANVVEFVENEVTGGIEFDRTIGLSIARSSSGIETGYTIISLITGQPDETYGTSACSQSVDTVNFTIGARGVKMTTASAATGILFRSIEGGEPFDTAQAVFAAVYIEDVTKVTSIGVDIYCRADLNAGFTWSRSAAQATLKNGWNYLRWVASTANIAGWGDGVYRARVVVVTTAATSITIGALCMERREKASVILINDGPYLRFMQDWYPHLKSLGIPLNISADPFLLGTASGVSARPTLAQLLDLMRDGNGNELSFHAWGDVLTSGMTADQIVTDTRKCQKWIRKYAGLVGSLFRSSYWQNTAPEYMAAAPHLLMQATGTNLSALTCWPPTNMDNVPRISIHGITPAAMTAYFGTLKKTRGFALIYIHAVDDAGGNNATVEQMQSFLSNAALGLEQGWLEFVTFEELFYRSGGKIVRSGSGYVASMDLPDGTKRSVTVA